MLKSLPTDTFLTKEQREAAITDIIDYFATERDEQIGIIAAETLLDMFLELVGTNVYNKGIEVTLAHMSERLEMAKFDAESQLKK